MSSQQTPAGNTNGHTQACDKSQVHRDEEGNLRENTPAWRRTIRDFQHSWVAIPMNTGLLALLFHQQPWQFDGLYILADIMYVFELVQLVVLYTAIILRYALYPSRTAQALRTTQDDLAMVGTMPIAFNVFAALTAIIVSNAPWGGHAFSLVAYVLWWIGTAWMLATAIFVVVTLIQNHEHELHRTGRLPETIFLPVVGLATDAVAGASVVTYGHNISAQLAVPVIIVSYFLVGLALMVSVFFYSQYMSQLITSGWNPAPRRPLLVLLIGPFGQVASAFLLLGAAITEKKIFAEYDRGTLLTASSGSSFAVASQLFGLICLGADFWIYFLAIAGLLEAAYKRQLSYSLFWWSTIFPVGTTNIAFTALATSLDSDAFRALSAAWTIFLVVDYLVNWGCTIWYSVSGHMLVKGEDVVEEEEKRD